MVGEALWSYIDELASGFFDPQKRVFWGYLASACLIAFVWLICCKGKTLQQAAGQVFARAAWWSRSARSDYRMMALNSGVMMVLSPRLLGQLGVSILVFEWMHGAFGHRPVIECPAWAVMMSFTACLFVVDDFARYVVHRLLHRVPVLWSFHKVHHTATSLNPITVFRTHPMEGVIFVVRGALVHGSCIGAFVFFFGEQVTLATVFGAAVFNFAFNALGANLRHSHIAVGFWKPVERVFISPAQHQIHHSMDRRHIDRNFGAALAVWDVMFGTHCHSEPDATLSFGIRGETGDEVHTLSALYWRPFKDAGDSIVRGWTRVIGGLSAGTGRHAVAEPAKR